eukprot:SAG22_NODE_16263_length_329_cov_1.108696_1_plen_63_part_01
MAEAERILVRLQADGGRVLATCGTAAATGGVEAHPPPRPAVLQLAVGQLYFENPPQRRCNATL